MTKKEKFIEQILKSFKRQLESEIPNDAEQVRNCWESGNRIQIECIKGDYKKIVTFHI